MKEEERDRGREGRRERLLSLYAHISPGLCLSSASLTTLLKHLYSAVHRDTYSHSLATFPRLHGLVLIPLHSFNLLFLAKAVPFISDSLKLYPLLAMLTLVFIADITK